MHTSPISRKEMAENVRRMLLGCCALSMQVSMLGTLFVGTDDVCWLHPHKIPQAWTFDVNYAPWHWRCKFDDINNLEDDANIYSSLGIRQMKI